MTASFTNITKMLLTPGCAEQLKQVALNAGNLAYYTLAKEILFARNALYAGVATTIIASLGSVYSSYPDNSAAHYTYLTLAGLGVGVTALTAKKLFDAGLFLKGVLEANRQRQNVNNTVNNTHAR